MCNLFHVWFNHVIHTKNPHNRVSSLSKDSFPSWGVWDSFCAPCHAHYTSGMVGMYTGISQLQLRTCCIQNDHTVSDEIKGLKKLLTLEHVLLNVCLD